MSDISGVSSTPSGMTGAGGGQKLRIVGMESGLDVDGVINKLMIPEKMKISEAEKKQQVLQWRQDAYKDIISDVKDLQDTYFNSLNKDTYLLSPDFFSAFDVTSSNDSALTATAGAGAEAGTYSVSFGTDGHLAESAVISGNKLAKAAGATDTNPISINTTMDTLGLESDTTLNINYNGKDYAIDVKTTDKLKDVMNNISKETEGKVTAKYSELTGQFTFKTSSTGTSQNIQLSESISNPSSKGVLDTLGITTTSAAGKDAIVYITPPGAKTPTKVTKSTNNFAIDGISYNLTKQEDCSITVTQDADKAFDKISKFVDEYNGIIDKIQTKLKEKKDLDFKPLSDDQKKQMTDSEIKAWEEKAKKGILRNDNNLQNLLTDLRGAFTSPVNENALRFGRYGSNTIGLDTSKKVIEEGDKIVIADKDKLMNAIKYNSQQLVDLFTNTSNIIVSDKDDSQKKIEDTKKRFNEQGIFSRMKDILDKNVGLVGTTLNHAVLTKYANLQEDFSITGFSGENTLPDQMYRQQKMIDKLKKGYDTKKESYYKQFSRLESAMAQLNAQQMWLMQQFQ